MQIQHVTTGRVFGVAGSMFHSLGGISKDHVSSRKPCRERYVTAVALLIPRRASHAKLGLGVGELSGEIRRPLACKGCQAWEAICPLPVSLPQGPQSLNF